jgi:serine acetyltransferase
VCVLGDVTIGHDSVIGANSVVVRSFPPYSTLFGVPARRVNVKAGTQRSAGTDRPGQEGPVLRSCSPRIA